MPHETYRRSIETNQELRAGLVRREMLLGYLKVATGLAGTALLVASLRGLHLLWGVAAAVAVYIVLANLHERVLSRTRDVDAVLRFYRQGMARLENRWAGSGEGGEGLLDPGHPYARDLDIFGRGSIFELLCTFRTRVGEQTLARWLLEPAQPDVIRTRQAAARELEGRTGLRERLFTAGNRARLALHPDRLTLWGERASSIGSARLSILMAALAAIWLGSLVAAARIWLRDAATRVDSGGHTEYLVLLLATLVNLCVGRVFQGRAEATVESLEEAAPDLDVLSEVLRVLEGEHLSSPRLVELQSALRVEGIPPSAAVRRLDRLVHALEQRENLAVRWFLGLLFYVPQLAMRAESWRRRYGPRIRGWIDAVGEIETLAAFSGYAFEHPGCSWPEITDDEAPLFEASGLAHPLLAGDAVGNDLTLNRRMQLMLLSGPNMSGKSTFVRGIGVNAVLAQCGAPVRAARLRMSRLQVGASISVQDSLEAGISRFYAEIRRLKLITDLAAGPTPVLFLLDELLAGTNSQDRLEGTRAAVQALVERDAIGLVTTHDLALARIPDAMDGRAENWHFEDHLEGGGLAFDFRLRPGVVQTSNALKLMESIGLPVPRSGAR